MKYDEPKYAGISPLKLLYTAYTDERPVASQVICAYFDDLEDYLAPLPQEKQEEVLRLFLELYCENERQAFVTGMKVGSRLAEELKE